MNIRKLNDLLSYLDDKFNINAGGCCFVAYCIAKNLEKIGVNYKLVLYTYERKINLHRTRNNIKFRKNNTFPIGKRNCNHYAIKVDNELINPVESDRYVITLSKINCMDIKYIYNMGYWNDVYDSINNYFIENTINKFFKNEEKK